MSPYFQRVGRAIGALLVALSPLFPTVQRLRGVGDPVKTISYGLLAALAGALVYYIFYLWQVRSVWDLTGVYTPVRKLKRPGQTLTLALRLPKYHKHYGRRREDQHIQKLLKERSGVMVVGERLSGKTRSSIEAVVSVKPRAYLLSFNPENFTHAKIEALLIPSPWILIKPEIVLFFDEIHKLVGRPFQALIQRLHGQCSRISIIATCTTGTHYEQILKDHEINMLCKHLLSTPVKLEPISEKEAEALETALGRDRSKHDFYDRRMPGAIVLQEDPKDRYAALPNDHKRVISGLRLAEACGISACETEFLVSILNEVLRMNPTNIEDILTALLEGDFLRIDRNRKLSITSDIYLDLDYLDYYQSISSFKDDLRELERMLLRQERAEQLQNLAIYYWRSLADLSDARHALESCVAINPKSAEYEINLACVIAALDPFEQEEQTLNNALNLVRTDNGKADAIMKVGDELYQRGSTARALDHYITANRLATTYQTRNALSRRLGDCYLRQGHFDEAHRAYTSWAKTTLLEDDREAQARLVVSLFGQRDFTKAESQLSMLLSETDTGVIVKRIRDLLTTCEECFRDNDALLKEIEAAVWNKFYDISSGQRIAILEYAEAMLLSGFLHSSRLGFEHLQTNASALQLTLIERVSSHINLGAIYRDMQCFERAIEEFESAKELVSADVGERGTLGSAIAGSADCKLMGSNDLFTSKKLYYEALELGKQANDATTQYWAYLGIGDVLLQEHKDTEALNAYLTMRLPPDSCSAESRLLTGLAKASLELGNYDDAEYYLLRGISICSRRAYRYRQQRLVDLHSSLKCSRRKEQGHT